MDTLEPDVRAGGQKSRSNCQYHRFSGQYISYFLQKDQSPRHRKLHNGVPGPPERVEPGSREFGVVVQPSALSGTSGVVRWRIAGGGPSGDRVMSVMWSKPYSQQFWRTWLAVGLSYPGKDMPSYKDMYSSKVIDKVKVKKQSRNKMKFWKIGKIKVIFGN